MEAMDLDGDAVVDLSVRYDFRLFWYKKKFRIVINVFLLKTIIRNLKFTKLKENKSFGI